MPYHGGMSRVARTSWIGVVVAGCVVVAACASTESSFERPKRFRVISYNVLVAYGDYRVGNPYLPGADRKSNILRFLANERPDVVAFQELNGYTPELLLADAKTFGHEHAVMLKANGYPTGLTSRYPIEVVERKLGGMHHGLMRVRTGRIDFVVVHLWPFKGQERLREVTPALAMVARARDERRPVIMLGDFNAVSRIDVPLFNAAAKARYRRLHWEHDERRLPRTDVLDACAATGLVDVWGEHRGELATLPLPRIDFILASTELAQRSIDARWIANDTVLKYSDHPAVVADFDWDPVR